MREIRTSGLMRGEVASVKPRRGSLLYKQGVLICEGEAERKNIGDYIQSLAARQFAGEDAMFVERERLDSYVGEPVKVALNAWFMKHPERFPPSPNIQPMFVSFHLRPVVEKAFFTEKTIAYLKRHAPIGCRDTCTVEAMRAHGIPAEFSSCSTLTLGEAFKRGEISGPAVFVDPYFNRLPKTLVARSYWKMLKRIVYGFLHFRTVSAIAPKCRVFTYWTHNSNFIMNWYYAAELYRAYTPVFAKDVLAKAEYITHKVPREGFSDRQMEELSGKLLRRYARAPFVVTSRLHCALPCIGIGTPVIVPYPDKTARGRFDGNDELMNVIRRDRGGRLLKPDWLKSEDGLIHSAADIPVRDDFRKYANNIAERCRAFFAEDGE